MPDGTQAEAETSSARSTSGWREICRAGGVSRRRGDGRGGGVSASPGVRGRVCRAGGVSARPGACPGGGASGACLPGRGRARLRGRVRGRGPRSGKAHFQAATGLRRPRSGGGGVAVQPWQRRVRGWGTQVRRLPGLGSAGSGPTRDGGLGGRGLRRTPGWGPPRDGGRGLQPVRGGWASGILPVCRETQGPAPDVVCLPPDSGRMKPAAARSLLLCALCLAMCRVGGASR